MDNREAADLLKKMIAIPSPSGGEEAIADLLEDKLKEMGFAPKRKGNNVWVLSPGWDEDKPVILLDGHLDSVGPSTGWSIDPYTPTIIGDKLYGLGSNDAGGSVVALLAAFTELIKKPQPYNLIFLASAEEENSGPGGVELILTDLGRIDFGVVGEPTGMHAAIAEKGLFVIDCIAHGKSGHAARGEGINAIYEAMKDIRWFRKYKFERVSPLLGEVKMTVTSVNADSPHNVVPSECRFTVDIRVNDCYTNKEIFDTIRQSINSTVIPHSFSRVHSSISPDHPFVRRAVDAGRKTYSSPTTSNQCIMPFTTLKIGPGKNTRAHTANEYIKLSEIEEGIDLYIKLLDGLQLQ